jgi:hypothetical protein
MDILAGAFFGLCFGLGITFGPLASYSVYGRHIRRRRGFRIEPKLFVGQRLL